MNRRMFVAGAAAALAAAKLLSEPKTFGQLSAEGNSSAAHLLLFGTDYYPDQTPENLWEQDAAQMEAMGVTNVRIAEFAWAWMEPQEGKFDFSWLSRSIRILQAHNIAVILGTPSAAPPNWLTQKYPEVMAVNDHGVTLATGSRRFTCPTNQTYRRLSLAIATAMAQAFASEAAVVGWQIDNELTLCSCPRCYCRYCREGFQQWLITRYHSLDAINQAWGTVFWSNTYTELGQIPVPLPSGAELNPGLVLDYDRYQSYANVTFLELQLAMLRKLCPAHFVTTNNITGLVDTINFRDLYRNLDFVASDNYPGFSALFPDSGPGTSLSAQAVAPICAFAHDSSRSVKDGKPFFIMEQQSGKAGQPYFSPQPEPGQLRLWTYQAVAHGAMGINYFRWDTADFGPEEYWHGLLRHDRSHSPGFDELRQTMRELKSLGYDALHAPYVADVALCYDPNSSWALSIQPGQPTLRYSAQIAAWYAAVSASHLGMDVVDATRDLSRYKILFAPVMYVVSPQQADQIRAFVQGGGTFIAGFRLGVKEESNRVVQTPLPGLLRDVMGVELLDYQPIYSDKQGVRFTGALAAPDAECRVWADILEPRQSDVLATYTTGAAAGKAAITSHNFGKGKAVYLGAHLEQPDLNRVLHSLIASSGNASPINAPSDVEVTMRRSNTSTLTYVLNHASITQSIKIPGRLTDILTGATLSGEVSVDAYGVRVIRTS
jgi:beta-galactosidase